MANTFHLQIATPDGMIFDAQAENIVVRTVLGDIAILAGHADYFTAISVGQLKVKIDGADKYAAVSGGFLRVTKDITRVVATTCEWAEEIDIERAVAAKAKAEQILAQSQDNVDALVAKMKIKRANNRIKVAEKTKK